MSRSKGPFASLLTVLVLAEPASARSAQPNPARILTRTGVDKAAVLMAMNGAQRKLRDSRCRRVLVDFRDGEGRSLEENLAPSRQEPEDYIALLTIRDGGEREAGELCRVPGVAAVTSPRSRVVYVCASFRLL